MKISVPREIKNNEFRVAITAPGVHELVKHGHEVFVETQAGVGSLITDAEYADAGATIVPTAAATWAAGDLLLKVKEPVAEEYQYLRSDQTVFTYLHLAADEALTRALVDRKVTSIAYETVQTPDRKLPLLAPMSEVAGRLSTQVGASALFAQNGGRGTLLAGIPGVRRGKVVVLGAGVAGINAARIAMGMGADVTILDISIPRLRQIDDEYGSALQTVVSNTYEITRSIQDADLVIGSVLIPGARAPKLVTNEMVAGMKPGSVLVDIAIDQGGCFADSRPTTHEDPTFTVHNSVFYCVANMPGAVPHTSTFGLTNATLPYVLSIADNGWRDALRRDEVLAKGLNTFDGNVTYAPVAAAHNLPAMPLADALLG